MRTVQLEVPMTEEQANGLLEFLDMTQCEAFNAYLAKLIEKLRDDLERGNGDTAAIRGEIRRLRKLANLRGELLAAKRA
jgi:vacuolar-type H+-ATPase subunit I/STV1